MTIEKKSLISALKTTKKANAVKEDISGNSTVTSPAQKVASIKTLSKAPASKYTAIKTLSKAPAVKY
jgi:hypothetical protein